MICVRNEDLPLIEDETFAAIARHVGPVPVERVERPDAMGWVTSADQSPIDTVTKLGSQAWEAVAAFGRDGVDDARLVMIAESTVDLTYRVQRLLRRNPAISARLAGASALRAKVFAQPLSQQPAYVLIGVEFSLQ